MSEKTYHDADGNEITLFQLCRRDPGWAASRIEHMESQLDGLLARCMAGDCNWEGVPIVTAGGDAICPKCQNIAGGV